MKKISYVIVAALLLNLGHALAHNPQLNEVKPAKALTTQIYQMLSENAIPSEIRGSRAEVRLAVDDHGYVRILSIETENEALKSFLKSSVDFKKVSKGSYQQGIVYRVPIEVSPVI